MEKIFSLLKACGTLATLAIMTALFVVVATGRVSDVMERFF